MYFPISMLHIVRLFWYKIVMISPVYCYTLNIYIYEICTKLLAIHSAPIPLSGNEKKVLYEQCHFKLAAV